MTTGGTMGSSTGGSPTTGGATTTGAVGGSTAQGGTKAAGGATAGGSTATSVGGVTAVGGTVATGGATASGGTHATDAGTQADSGNSDGGIADTFTGVYTDIISARCLSCHVPGGVGVSLGMLDMSTKALAYADLVGASGMGVAAAGSACGTSGLLRVTPGDHATSLLWEKVNAKLMGTTAPCGNPMPAGSANAALTLEQVEAIAAWIDSGAHDN